MSVLEQVVEKISSLKMPINVDNLIFEAETKPLSVLLPDLQKFNIHADDGSDYSVYLVNESSPEAENDSNLTASLAGFYNSRYVFEYLKHDRVKAPIGSYRFFIRKRCADNPENIFVALVLRWPQSLGHTVKSTLTLDETYHVAEVLANLHSRGFQRPTPKSREIVNENHEFVEDFLTSYLRENFDHFLHVLFSHNRNYFVHSERAHSVLHELYNTFSCFNECIDSDDGLPKILCHGNFCAENLRFNEQNELIGIVNWEHSSFGHIGLDLTYLMTSSLSTTDRRQNYLRILRHYYYSLVDKQTVPFKLHDLKESYHRLLKYAVFFNIFGLVFTLESKNSSDQIKQAAIEKWEQTLYEAHDVETNRYVSDNEDIRIF